jgi:glucose-1-phosphatase
MILQPHIKSIIFDLGGVLLNLDYNRTTEAFKRLGIAEFERIYSQARQKQLFDEYEKGLIGSEEFRAEMIALLEGKPAPHEIDTAWNAMLLDLPHERLRLLEKLKSKYRLFLLSNTNDIHITAYSAYLLEAFGFPDLSHIFEKEYYSYRVGKRKPDKEIFELVLSENGLQPHETVFIDDSIQHVEGARVAGINAYHLQPPLTIMHLLAKEAGFEPQ